MAVWDLTTGDERPIVTRAPERLSPENLDFDALLRRCTDLGARVETAGNGALVFPPDPDQSPVKIPDRMGYGRGRLNVFAALKRAGLDVLAATPSPDRHRPTPADIPKLHTPAIGRPTLVYERPADASATTDAQQWIEAIRGRLDTTTSAVGLTIAAYQARGEQFNVEQLAADVACSPSTIKRATARMREDGWLVALDGENRRNGEPVAYELAVPSPLPAPLTPGSACASDGQLDAEALMELLAEAERRDRTQTAEIARLDAVVSRLIDRVGAVEKAQGATDRADPHAEVDAAVLAFMATTPMALTTQVVAANLRTQFPDIDNTYIGNRLQSLERRGMIVRTQLGGPGRTRMWHLPAQETS